MLTKTPSAVRINYRLGQYELYLKVTKEVPTGQSGQGCHPRSQGLGRETSPAQLPGRGGDGLHAAARCSPSARLGLGTCESHLVLYLEITLTLTQWSWHGESDPVRYE